MPRMSRSALGLRPAVVFVNDERWESFFQLAAIVRKAGFRTVRISVGLSGWQAEDSLFDRNVFLSSPPSPQQLSEILLTEYVADVQPTESLAVTTYAALELLPPSTRSDIWNGRSLVLDKWDISRVFHNLGLQTPDTLLADVTTPHEAVEQFSLPIVLKRRVGSSGSNVGIFTSLETLQTFAARLDSPDHWFYERFIPGRSLVCASCVSDDGIDVIATYEVLKRTRLYGPSSVVEFQEDPRLVESGRSAIEALNIRGFVCFDMIRDSQGVDWIHDVNPRVFGGLSMCQLAGFDFRGAYLRCLTGRGDIEPSRPPSPGTKIYGFPQGRKELFRSKPHGAWLVTLQWLWRHWELLGTRYFLVYRIKRPLSSFQQRWRMSGMRRQIPSPHRESVLPD
jgi:hypothetical protein